MINIRKKLLDIAFQDPTSTSVVLGNFAGEVAETVYGAVSSLPLSTRIRVVNKFAVEIWIQNSVNSMMEQPVADSRLVDIARFRVVYFERLIFAVVVCFIFQVVMQSKYIVREL